ncbi:MAG: SGNH/GDSL hydrolase family protein [Candidatus Nanopelagicaceae bacterium]
MSNLTRTPLLQSAAEIVGPYDHLVSDDGWVSFSRLPLWTWKQFGVSGLHRWTRFPSGVRLRFRTEASTIALEVHVMPLTIARVVEEPAVARFDLLVDGVEAATVPAAKGGQLRLEMDGPLVTSEEFIRGEGEEITFANLKPGVKEIEIWLPAGALVEIRNISADSEILPPTPSQKKKWVHYGSSISQCAETERPLDIWSVHASRLLGLDIRNLGLAGECHIDGFVARTIADTPADFISLKLGINVVNGDSMRERSFIPAVHNFLDTIREKKPNTPILIISPIICPFHEVNPGPTLIGDVGLTSMERPATLAAGALNLPKIRAILEKIVAEREDAHLYFMNGLELFNEGDLGMMPDLLHPNSAGYRLMGERFAAKQKDFISRVVR